ncbi:MAG: F0F1 ATP synthase subunit delta [Methylococcales bacterium]
MEFNVSTFALEIINFLVLVWILQRLFYKPLLTAIAKRKQAIDQTLADAQLMQQQADQQRNLYENRQKLWEQEKQSAMAALQQQLEEERSKQMQKLLSELDLERQKASVTLLRQQQDLQQQAEKQALQNGAQFTALLLKQAAGPELEARLFNLLLERITSLPETCKQCLHTPTGKKAIPVKISSAYGLNSEQQQVLEQQFAGLVTNPLNFQYFQNADLIAGLRIDIGAWVLNANLQHELIGFTELVDDTE